ncbi:GtrA family protein [Pseudomonas aeruginosa]
MHAPGAFRLGRRRCHRRSLPGADPPGRGLRRRRRRGRRDGSRLRGSGCLPGHRRKTFRHRGPVFRSLPRFFAVSLLCVLGNAVLVLLLGDLAGLDYRLAQLAATGALLLATYHLHRLWTFS